jgi:hypothetical protein
MIIILAWMSLSASVTLSALLTVILLPWAWAWAWAKVRQSLILSGMMWRGETWKYQCLRLAALLSEPRSQYQQSRQPLTSKPFSYRGGYYPYADVRSVLPYASVQSLVSVSLGERHNPAHNYRSDTAFEVERCGGNCSSPLTDYEIGQLASSVPWRPPLHGRASELRLRSQEGITVYAASKSHTEPTPTPIDFI